MRDLVYMASRDKVDVDKFHKGIQYALERLGKSKFAFESTTVSNFKSKSHEGSGNELVDQKARGLWERDWHIYTRGKRAQHHLHIGVRLGISAECTGPGCSKS